VLKAYVLQTDMSVKSLCTPDRYEC